MFVGRFSYRTFRMFLSREKRSRTVTSGSNTLMHQTYVRYCSSWYEVFCHSLMICLIAIITFALNQKCFPRWYTNMVSKVNLLSWSESFSFFIFKKYFMVISIPYHTWGDITQVILCKKYVLIHLWTASCILIKRPCNISSNKV